jgi:hypothetical protein
MSGNGYLQEFEEAVLRVLWWFNEGELANISLDATVPLPSSMFDTVYEEDPEFSVAEFTVDVWWLEGLSIQDMTRTALARLGSVAQGMPTMLPPLYHDDIVADLRRRRHGASVPMTLMPSSTFGVTHCSTVADDEEQDVDVVT